MTASPLPAEKEIEKNRLNFLLITIDTLRADRLSHYSNELLQTPNIDSFAQKGILFSRAFAHTPTTLPSHTNILLGATPLFHGVRANSNFIVREEFVTMAEHLKNYGYSTGAFIGGFPLASEFGLNQGFDSYDDDFGRRGLQRHSLLERKAEAVVDNALKWLSTQRNPWFLWIHCYDPHDPYEPPEPFKSKYAKNPYDGEVAYVDLALGKLLTFMKEHKYFDNTLVVLTGDHGESLGQHGEVTHGLLAYNTTMWIPLIITLPSGEQGKVDQYVGHTDIFPTVCDVLNIDKPSFLQGISLLPAIKGKKLQNRSIYFESLDPYYTKGWAPLTGFIHEEEKFIESPIPELYDLNDDFDEHNNLAKGEKLEKYRSLLEQIAKNRSSPGNIKANTRIDRDSLEKLKSLGYISSSGSQDPCAKVFGPEDDIKVLLPYYNKTKEAVDLYRKGKAKEGLELLNDIIKERKDFAVAYYNLAILYKESGKFTDALDILKLGLERFPANYELFFNYVSYLLIAGKHDEVIRIIGEKNLREMEYDPNIWLNLGVAYSNKGDLRKAIEAFEKALSLDSENPTVLNSLGNVYYYLTLETDDQKLFQKCLETFKKAIELDPDYASPYNGLGAVYRLADNLDGAIYCWEKALELQPDYDTALYSLGLAYSDKGEFVKALDYLNKYKKQNSHLLPPGERKKLDDFIQKCKQKL